MDVSDYQSGTDGSSWPGRVWISPSSAWAIAATPGALSVRTAASAPSPAAHAPAGIDVGAYFFSQAVTVQEAIMEADYVLGLLDGVPLDLPVYFDWDRYSPTIPAPPPSMPPV